MLTHPTVLSKLVAAAMSTGSKCQWHSWQLIIDHPQKCQLNRFCDIMGLPWLFGVLNPRALISFFTRVPMACRCRPERPVSVSLEHYHIAPPVSPVHRVTALTVHDCVGSQLLCKDSTQKDPHHWRWKSILHIERDLQGRAATPTNRLLAPRAVTWQYL